MFNNLHYLREDGKPILFIWNEKTSIELWN